MKIVLMGYMGSGKSTIGDQLAKSLNISFLDLDQVIEEKEQIAIAKLFATKGEIYFRKKEREVLEDLLCSKKEFVLATGGGTPCFGDTVDFINSKEETIVVYLKASSLTLTERLFKDRKKRPLIAHIDSEELLEEFIRKHLFERSYYYNQAKIVIETDNLLIEEIVVKIVNSINTLI